MSAPDKTARHRPSRWWLLLWVPLAVLAVALGAFVIWGSTPLGPTDTALAALESGAGVTVAEVDGGWEFRPTTGATPETGVVFYPGGHVDARSYAPFARDLAAKGHLVIVVRMPLSLAVLNPNAADRYIAGLEYAEVKRWALAGHSLGGAMAAQYTADHRDAVDGLVLLAAYASGEGSDISGTEIGVTDVTGTADGVLDQANWRAGHALIPPDAAFVSIDGGNHAQFGDYGPQPGDNPATISADEQRRQSVEAADELLGGL